ncbi:hypothetical protein BD410DRAFT_830912 [Rickenella mellea]|uniref:Uncharacterized protein n=1 Tax=Rickenella mellea TaxID=50990 RepID=A0A4Y7PV27_9AGAM|nr:hypothetical protein BD410DRAFT_830912 [Rickenella mellea]
MARSDTLLGSQDNPILISGDDHGIGSREMGIDGKRSQVETIVISDDEYRDGERDEEVHVEEILLSNHPPRHPMTCSYEHTAHPFSPRIKANSKIRKMATVRSTNNTGLSTAHPCIPGPVSPIYRIPSEVFLEIFTYCVSHPEFPRPSVRSAPLQLCHVCRIWRKLAITTPRLWCKILLGPREFEGSHEEIDSPSRIALLFELYERILKVWMERAEGFLMSVHIRYTPSDLIPPVAEDLSPHAFRAVMKFPARWISVRLSMPGNHLAWTCMVTQRYFPNLKILEVDDTSIPAVGPASYKRPIFLEASVARRLSTLSVRGSIHTRRVETISFSRLRILSLTHACVTECLHLLKHCPALEDLTLQIYGLFALFIPFEEHIILLPRLENLHLSHTRHSETGDSSVSRCGEFGQLLEWFKLPMLRSFYLSTSIIGSGTDVKYDTWDYFSRLIVRSNCSLNRLELLSPHIKTSTILECLHLSPDLRYLGIPANEDLEHKIARVLPGLESLCIFKPQLSQD